jgi:hypothetical protein
MTNPKLSQEQNNIASWEKNNILNFRFSGLSANLFNLNSPKEDGNLLFLNDVLFKALTWHSLV